MEDGYRLIDYGININDVVQLMIRAAPLPPPAKGADSESPSKTSDTEETEKKSGSKKSDEEVLIDSKCEYYEVLNNYSNIYLESNFYFVIIRFKI